MLRHAPKGSITALNQHFACYKTCNEKSNPAFITVIGTMCLGLLINKSIHKILIIILLVSMFFAISDVHPGWQYVPEKCFFFSKHHVFRDLWKSLQKHALCFKHRLVCPLLFTISVASWNTSLHQCQNQRGSLAIYQSREVLFFEV